MTYAAKIRGSTTKQDLESQKHTLQEWADKNGHTIVFFEEFATSGRKVLEERENMQELLTRCESGEFEGLVVVEISRLGRSIKMIYDIVERLSKAGIKIVLANSNTTLDYNTLEGRALIGGLALAADIEWMLISERNKRGREKIKREGIKVGRRRSEEKISITAILTMRATGLSYRQISNELNCSPPTIMRMLRRYKDGQKSNVTEPNQIDNTSHIKDNGVTLNNKCKEASR